MNKIWIWVVIIVLLVGGFIWWQSAQAPAAVEGTPAPSAQTPTQVPTQDSSAQTGGATVGGSANVDMGIGDASAPQKATVTYTDTGFSPSTVTISQGGTVTFVNKSTSGMWVASNPHPAHSGYDGTSRSTHCSAGYTGPKPFDECADAFSFTFTFTKSGTWGYHNHENEDNGGTVIVQ